MSTTQEAEAGGGRLRELQAFDDTKAGVKGLVDAGVTTVPAIFRHHRQEQAPAAPTSSSGSVIPVIDLSAADDAAARHEVVAQVRAAAEAVGFFQVVNHGVPRGLLEDMLASVRRFHEAPAEAKRPYYTRDPARRLRFNSNFDLFQSPAANWRDTLFCEAAPEPPWREDLPPDVRHVMLEYGAAARALAARVLGLLSEALGLERGHLAGIGCADGVSLVCNYYPPCPEPEATVGCSRHSDPSFLTVLLQGEHPQGQGGLQVLLRHHQPPHAGDDDGHESGDQQQQELWVDVPAVPGALVVNIGDLLQLVSNGRFRSVEHRVLANSSRDTARISVACFCNADIARSTRRYGPIVASSSSGSAPAAEQAVYRSVTVPEFLAHYDKKGLDGRPALDHFLLHQR